jgi:hypothetical protein
VRIGRVCVGPALVDCTREHCLGLRRSFLFSAFCLWPQFFLDQIHIAASFVCMMGAHNTKKEGATKKGRLMEKEKLIEKEKEREI